MTKLTDTQLVLLSAASQRDDGVIPITDRLKGGIAIAVGNKLIALGLAEERIASPLSRGWRESDEGQRFLLIITPAGLAAIGVYETDARGSEVDATEVDAPNSTIRPGQAPPVATKKAMVIELLRRECGTSLHEIVGMTGWLPHTTRAALTGLRRTGAVIETVRQAGCTTRYRIINTYDGAGA
jgi:hypothetical protein